MVIEFLSVMMKVLETVVKVAQCDGLKWQKVCNVFYNSTISNFLDQFICALFFKHHMTS